MRSQNASSVSRRQVIASAYASAAFWRSSYLTDFLEIDQVVVMRFLESFLAPLNRALVAAVLALDRA
jgi:hypothetical protein